MLYMGDLIIVGGLKIKKLVLEIWIFELLRLKTGRLPEKTTFCGNHLEERLLDQVQAQASYTPPFLRSFA